jgi:hypothetical protein
MGREDYIVYLENLIVDHPLEGNHIVSKVVQGKEKGNKNRVVCIQNFWIQQLMGDIQSVVEKRISIYERYNSCH